MINADDRDEIPITITHTPLNPEVHPAYPFSIFHFHLYCFWDSWKIGCDDKGVTCSYPIDYHFSLTHHLEKTI